MIKKYLQFIKESKKNRLGCVMLEVPVNNWSEITSIIDKKDVYKKSGFGIEDNPHLTLFYGLHKEVSDEKVKKVLDNKKDFNIEIQGIDIFENDEFDVVKFNVKKTKELQNIFNEFSNLPNSNEYPDYQPHITIAYVKKGKGKKYTNKNYKHKVKNASNIIYSKPNGSKLKFKLLKESLYSGSHNDKDNFTSDIGREIIWGSKAKVCFYFQNEYICDSKEIYELIEKYKYFYNKENCWSGGPPPKGFIEYFKKYNNNVDNFHPSIALKIETTCGLFIIGFSLKTKKRNIESYKYASKEEGWALAIYMDDLSKSELKYDEFIDVTNLEVENKIDWDWKTSLNENKMFYKSIPEILSWIEEKSKIPWLMIDTETTGLQGSKKEQLTQISSIIGDYDPKQNLFKEISYFDKKIKLTDETKSKYNNKGDKTKFVLSFNRYGSGDYKYQEEKETIDEFFKFISYYEPCLMIAQNAQFDMEMLGGRYGHKIKSEVFDTKSLIQLYFLPLIQKLAESDEKYEKMVKFIGKSKRDNGLISSSMSKIGPALNIDMKGYHDALTDCKLMTEMLIKIIDLLKKYKGVDISKYQNERIKILKNEKI